MLNVDIISLTGDKRVVTGDKMVPTSNKSDFTGDIFFFSYFKIPILKKSLFQAK